MEKKAPKIYFAQDEKEFIINQIMMLSAEEKETFKTTMNTKEMIAKKNQLWKKIIDSFRATFPRQNIKEKHLKNLYQNIKKSAIKKSNSLAKELFQADGSENLMSAIDPIYTKLLEIEGSCNLNPLPLSGDLDAFIHSNESTETLGKPFPVDSDRDHSYKQEDDNENVDYPNEDELEMIIDLSDSDSDTGSTHRDSRSSKRAKKRKANLTDVECAMNQKDDINYVLQDELHCMKRRRELELSNLELDHKNKKLQCDKFQMELEMERKERKLRCQKLMLEIEELKWRKSQRN